MDSEREQRETRDAYGYVLCCHGRPMTCRECGEDYAADLNKPVTPSPAEAQIRQLREALEKARAVIEAVRAVGKRGHWDAPHWMLRVPAAEANALFDLAYAVDPELVAALAASTGQETP